MPSLAMGATFTIDPVAEAYSYWTGFLGLPMVASVVPYGQFLPHLLNPGSDFRSHKGSRALFVRPSDLRGQEEETAAVLRSIADIRPLLIILCPDLDEAQGKGLTFPDGAEIINAAEFFEKYQVSFPFDARADQAGHIPYTPEAMAVLGTVLARWMDRNRRPPLKLIAVDGDQTLWRGVLGEDGADGITLSDQDRRLQTALKSSAHEGRILGLFSKNDAADVESLLGQREDFLLRRDDFLAVEANWQDKPSNLTRVADQFAVGQNAILFLDDNPVECAAMRAAMPGVATVQVPKDQPGFADHLWLMDQAPATDEDRARQSRYREEEQRSSAMATAPSLEDFFASLELDIDVRPSTAADTARLSQMTLRTNQFNASLQRCDESEITASLSSDDEYLWTVSVRDKFGDYGIVGMMRARAEEDVLLADLFLLSCRALGRGVEHAMLRQLGKKAAEIGHTEVAVKIVKGPRNEPVRSFLGTFAAVPEEGEVRIHCKVAAEAAFIPGGETLISKPAAAVTATNTTQSATLYEWIATEMTTGDAIFEAMQGEYRQRPEGVTPYVAPAPGLPTTIAAIWQRVLRIRPIGVNDDFAALGGKSLHLVRINSLLSRHLDSPIDITTLFRFSTIGELARHLGGDEGRDAMIAARALKLRAATDALAARRRGAGGRHE